jgi:histidine ammonia-lyase
VAIEMLVGLDAVELRRPLRSGRRLEAWIRAIRKVIARAKGDRFLAPELEQAADLVSSGTIVVP